ncbi:hypothetical protein VNO77_11566 [Canavalia gladiata]|uniref:Uncharacterized protein n=1 Tax=Canavalia gladiata TaxID=3824 RepID=A0AAN9MD10_CANGL
MYQEISGENIEIGSRVQKAPGPCNFVPICFTNSVVYTNSFETLLPKDANHENSNDNDTNDGGGSQVDDEEKPKVVIITPNNDEKVKEKKVIILSKIEVLEEKGETYARNGS